MGATEIPCENDRFSGSEFLAATANLSRDAREESIFDAVVRGVVPSFVHQFADVALEHDSLRGLVRVSLDYVGIGTDDDFVRIPMSPITAQRLADHFGYVLPTRWLVDAIYQAAALKLEPRPLPPGSQMMSNDYYRRHHELVEKQRAGRGGLLVAGHKKDVVVTPQLVKRPTQVAIYGWHRLNGKPIQPLSLVHEASYADYSHGIRFLRPTMIVGDEERDVREVARDPALCGLVSDEGRIALMRAAAPFR